MFGWLVWRDARAWFGAFVLTVYAGAGCRDQVALGSWELQGSAGMGAAMAMPEAGAAGAAAGAREPPGLPACAESAPPGATSMTGSSFGITETATDWMLPAPAAALEWQLMVEREVAQASTSPPTGGYYYAHQFAFLEGLAGFFGIQDEGGYQQDPPSSPVDFTKMAVFWLGGPPLAGELGDIAYPDARVAPATVAGVGFLTIHARFDWEACHVYRFRFGPHATEADGNIWYGATIEDVSSGVETFLGRMLLPADVGLLAPFSTSRTIPIEFGELEACDSAPPGSAVFEAPYADGEQASLSAHRFVEPLRCTTSRFSAFPGAVRHELGLLP
jgi:hypothetical protein